MSGLFLISFAICWFAIAVWVSGWLAQKVRRAASKAVVVAISLLVLVPLPVVDEVVGLWQFHRVCGERAKMTVDAQRIKGKSVRLVIDPSWAPVSNTAIPIRYSRYSYRDAATGEELASYKDFDAEGGVFARATGILRGNAPLLLGKPWCGPADRGSFPAIYGFTLVN